MHLTEAVAPCTPQILFGYLSCLPPTPLPGPYSNLNPRAEYNAPPHPPSTWGGGVGPGVAGRADGGGGGPCRERGAGRRAGVKSRDICLAFDQPWQCQCLPPITWLDRSSVMLSIAPKLKRCDDGRGEKAGHSCRGSQAVQEFDYSSDTVPALRTGTDGV
jgi:hypothetical protein